MSQAILKSIADIDVADVPGAALRGKTTGLLLAKEKRARDKEGKLEALKEQFLKGELEQPDFMKQTILIDPEGAGKLQSAFSTLNTQQLKSGFSNVAAAMAIDDIGQQKQYLEMAMKDMGDSPEASTMLTRVSQLEGDDLQKGLIQLANLGQFLGHLPPPTSTTQKFLKEDGGQALVQKASGELEWITPEGLNQLPPVMDMEGKRKRVKDLRATFDKKTVSYDKIKESYGRIGELKGLKTGAGDLGMIFNYMKMLDPGSVVRESEYKTAEEARAGLAALQEAGVKIPTYLVQLVNKFRTGQKLTDEQRGEFVAASDGLYSSANTDRDDYMGMVLDRATADGVEHADVVGPNTLAEYQKRLEDRKKAAEGKGKDEGNDTPPAPASDAQVVYENKATGEIATLVDGQWVITKKE